MKKLLLLCMMVATLCSLALAEYQVNLPGFEAAQERYYQLIDKVVDGSATNAEAAEFSDLCQVYGLDVPVITEPEEQQLLDLMGERERENLDQGKTDTLSPYVEITACPFIDTGNFDGDNECSAISASPYNEVYFRYANPPTGWYQMRVRSYTTGNAAIRILRPGATGTGICLGAINVAFSSSSVATDCKNPIAAGMEPTTVVTYVAAYLKADSVYWIHVGTSSSTVSTLAYDFNIWCTPRPAVEEPQVHNTCATAFEIACNDSLWGDSAYYSTSTTWDWYKIVVPDYSPMACSLYVFVGGREMGHYNSGRYPTYTSSYPYSIDGQFTLWKERAGQPCVNDSVVGGFGYDDGCSYDAVRTVAVAPGTYYIKVWNSNYYEYVLKTACIEYNPIAACCFMDQPCADMAQAACALAGGWAKPIGVLCATNPCPATSCPGDLLDNETVNNACGPAVPAVVCDGWYCGVIPMISDSDWYQFVVPEGVCETLWVDIYGNDTPSMWPAGQGLDPVVRLVKDGCWWVLGTNWDNNGVDPLPVLDDSRLKYTIVRPGTYYIQVYSEYGLVGPYLMHITCTPFTCPELLPGDLCANSRVIGGLPFEDAAQTTCGYVDDYRVTCMGTYSNGPDIIYTIYLDGATCITCSLTTTTSQYGSVSLYANCPTNPAEPCIAKSVGQYSGPYGFTCQGLNGALPAGTYYIMVDNYSATCLTSYTLKVNTCECPTPCPWENRDTEPLNNTCGVSVPPIACDEKLCGEITLNTDVDWYQFMIPEGQCDSLWIKVYGNDTPGEWPLGKGLDPIVSLYKADCVTLVGTNDDIGGSPFNDDSWLRTSVLFSGTYYIKVACYSTYIGPYVLNLTCFVVDCPDTTGETCADARNIPSPLPYYDTNTTCSYYTDDYNATCLGSYDNGPDVLYKFEVLTKTCATCSLTNVTASSWPGLAVFDGCPDVGTCMIYKTGTSGPLGTSCLVFEPGHVYYIMVDNYPAPACVGTYRLELEPCDCPMTCEEYVLCGSPAETEANNTCPPPVGQAEITCNSTVYGLHCLSSDVDFWKVTIAPMSIMTIKVYTGPTCSVNPAVGVLFRYYDALCASPTTGVATSVVISNATADPLVKYLEVYDTGLSQTLYKIEATCCQMTNYCVSPILVPGGVYKFTATVNTCCATNVIDTVGSLSCVTGSRFASGPDVIFKFSLATTGIVSCSARTVTTGDGQFSIFTDCANPKTSCVMSRDSTTGTSWEVKNGIVLPAGTYYASVSAYGLTACGDMEIRLSADIPLPVNLLGDVVATPGNEKVTLSWTTASETNNARFEIVRNGHVIGQVEGAGTNTTRKSYMWSEEGLNNGRTYSYTLRSVDINENVNELATVEATPSFAAGEVTEYALHQNYPNPFNPTTSIAFDLLESGNVTLKIFNLMGQEVRTVVNGVMPKGRQIVSFDAGNLSSGIYLYRVEVNGFV